ncbi:class I SAM-dependent methyltransferase [Streptomyces sp. NA02950]|uniref:class I SAM-dependent methyltransferase n=1 Tax=Streptomyces sp. NA02950 TaxID=2742137 RepID=UPI0015927D5B|nr:class I SAM-dependent methyltransferase [Streptomyces sp. NA02950]QKV95854.1 class I SAM-dependent methyltransferase [Streptomyces sp. NA02950]
MTATDTPRYTPDWLELREGADAAARAPELVDSLRAHLAARPAADGPLVVHDLGCGTGAMGRWLAPRLNGAQRWVLHDRDPRLLQRAAEQPPCAADGTPVTVETRRGDLSRLTAGDLAGASLVTASALLDVLTREEVDRLAALCAEAGCPVLLALSVVGRVELTPADPLDDEILDAFNAHQRRGVLLGPDAVTVATASFERQGVVVRTHCSPWHLGPEESALTAEWLRGWVGAAKEQRSDLGARADAYLRRRLAVCETGGLRAVVHHRDLLALPGPVEAAA